MVPKTPRQGAGLRGGQGPAQQGFVRGKEERGLYLHSKEAAGGSQVRDDQV